jgi:hypothetical protein
MGFRSAIKAGGGGFLNNVDVELVSYEFSPMNFNEKKPGDYCYFVPTLKVDGADDPIVQHLFIGGNERYEISDDGQELTMADGEPVTFSLTVGFGRFMDSLTAPNGNVEKGFPEDELPDLEAGEALNLAAIVGKRFRVKQEIDVKRTADKGPRKVKNKKTGKIVEYPHTYTVVDAVLGASNGNGSKSSAKPAGKAAKSDDDAVEERAVALLQDVLDGTTVNRKNLSLPVTKALMKEKDKVFAAAVKAQVLDEDWQDEQDWLEVDKKNNLSLAA